MSITLTETPLVVNKYKDPFDVYIGRGSQWGNPFVVGRDGGREDVIRLFYEHLRKRVLVGEITLESLAALQGKRLGCFCAPRPCHGAVIAAFSDWAMEVLHSDHHAD